MGYRGVEATISESRVWGEPEREEQEMICCPELDSEGYGRPNFLKSACLYRQQDAEWKVPSCYGGCKGKASTYVKPKTDAAELARRRAERGRGIEAEAIRQQIITLHKQGLGPTAIAIEVGRGRSLVEKRLAEEGLVVARGYGPDSLKQQIFRWLDDHPEAKTVEIMKAFYGTPKGTAESYRTQWRRKKRS